MSRSDDHKLKAKKSRPASKVAGASSEKLRPLVAPRNTGGQFTVKQIRAAIEAVEAETA